MQKNISEKLSPNKGILQDRDENQAIFQPNEENPELIAKLTKTTL